MMGNEVRREKQSRANTSSSTLQAKLMLYISNNGYFCSQQLCFRWAATDSSHSLLLQPAFCQICDPASKYWHNYSPNAPVGAVPVVAALLNCDC